MGREIHDYKFVGYLFAFPSNEKTYAAPKEKKKTRTSGNAKEKQKECLKLEKSTNAGLR